MSQTYDEVTRALSDVLEEREREREERGANLRGRGGSNRWPAWLQTVIVVGTMIVTITLAYAALDKRISLVEQKLDFVIRQVK